MIFSELLIYCKVKAIESLLTPTEETIWRAFCRSYSERWHVPLPKVRAMDPEEVIAEVLEARYEEMDAFEEIEGILEDIYKIENPRYEKQQKVEMDSFIQNMAKREQKRLSAEQEREERRASKLRPEPPKTPPQPKRSGGSVDFSKLNNDK